MVSDASSSDGCLDEDFCPDLAAELEETRKVRDQWCAEYVRVRDELAALKATIGALTDLKPIQFMSDDDDYIKALEVRLDTIGKLVTNLARVRMEHDAGSPNG
jgi:hypothetical protein